MDGVRSCQAPDSQNLPTLSSPNDSTASGGVPELIAWMIFWSPTPPTLFTVIHGYSAVKSSKIWLNCFSSRPVHAPQISIVTGSWDTLGFTVGGGDSSSSPPAVQAPAISANTASAVSMRFMTNPLLPILLPINPPSRGQPTRARTAGPVPPLGPSRWRRAPSPRRPAAQPQPSA